MQMLAHFAQCRWRGDDDQLFKFLRKSATLQHIGGIGREARLLQIMEVHFVHGAAMAADRIVRSTRRIGCLITVGGIVLLLNGLRLQIGIGRIALVPEEQHLATIGHQHHRIMFDLHRLSPLFLADAKLTDDGPWGCATGWAAA